MLRGAWNGFEGAVEGAWREAGDMWSPWSSKSTPPGSPRRSGSQPRTPRKGGGQKLEEDAPGPYIIVHSGAAVGPKAAPGDEPIASLNYGDRVEVLEVRQIQNRVRGRIRCPAGWLSLASLDCGHRWAKRAQDSEMPPPQESSGGRLADSTPPRRCPPAGSNFSPASRSTAASSSLASTGNLSSSGGGRKPREEKHPKVVAPSTKRAKGCAAPPPAGGDPDKWKYQSHDGCTITVTTTNKVRPVKVNSKEEAVSMVKQNPGKYFGCFWVKEPYQGKAMVYPRDCTFFESGVKKSSQQPEAYAAMKAEYCALPATYSNFRPDSYTQSCLAKFESTTLSSKSPGRQQGIADAPGLKFIGEVDPNDIKQGGVGDCWLLSAISALAEFEGSIHTLFSDNGDLDSLPRPEFNRYKIRLYDLQKWKPVDVVVDERLLWDEKHGGIFGCKPTNDNEIWPCVLEKAVAAHCGGWEKINGGQSTHAWRLLLGCREVYTIEKKEDGKFGCFSDFNPNTHQWEPCANSPHDGFQGLWPSEWPEVGGGGNLMLGLDETALFKRMCAWDDANFIMCAGSEAGSDKTLKNGIVEGHAYTIIECIDNAGGSQYDMVKMRNPWGCQEFDSGGWGDDGPMWKKNPEVFKACGRPKPADDGVFWMERQNFFKYFTSVYLCATDVSKWTG